MATKAILWESMMIDRRNILIAGGGTGGHLFPALAVGDWLSSHESVDNVFYIGSSFGIEAETFKAMGVPHALLPIRGLQRSLDLQSLSRNALLPGRMLRSWFKTQRIFNKFKPDVVLGTGGYASALPLKVAASRKIPFVLQEQNSYPGMTTRMFAEKAYAICLGFERANEFLAKKGSLTGNPVRRSINKGDRHLGLKFFDLDPEIKTAFVFGGSQGSLFLNNIIAEMVKNNPDLPFQLIWQTGPRMVASFKSYSGSGISVVPFIEEMKHAYAASDIVISRAGALTLAELALCGIPSILIPLPSSAGGHQLYNAKVFKDAGAAELIEENSAEGINIFNTITRILNDKELMERMHQSTMDLKFENATETIGKAVLEAAFA